MTTCQRKQAGLDCASLQAPPSSKGLLTGKRVLFYTDAVGFGGHEVLSLKALGWLLDAGAAVVCYYRADNKRWATGLEAIADNPALKCDPLKLPYIRYHALYHAFRPALLRRMTATFAGANCDFAFISQGNLASSALGTLAANKAHLPSISYIPMAHGFREMNYRAGWQRDRFNRYLAKIPDYWLTCDTPQIHRLRALGATQPIDILPNWVELSRIASHKEARKRAGLDPDTLVLGMVGRLGNSQKACDVFANALAMAPAHSPLRRAQLLFMGEGPDWERTRKTLAASGYGERIRHLPWTGHPGEIYPAYDLIAMPSHFEGMPMVMQEAILCGVAIAASNVDGMGTFLPSVWKCPPGNPQALLQLLESFASQRESYRQPLSGLQQYIHQQYSRDAFSRALSRTISTLMAQKGIAEAT